MAINRRTALTTLFGAGVLLSAAACSGPTTANSTPAAPAGGASASAPTPVAANPALAGALDKIRSKGVIRIGMEGTYPPYSMHAPDGALVGIEKEIGDLIAQDLGVKPEYIETKWDSLIAGMDVDKYDVVINQVVPTEARKAKYDFSVPYGRVIGKAGVGKDSPIATLDDLKGKRAAQTASSNWGATAKELGATLVPVDGFTQSVELVTTGRADVTLNDLVSFQKYLAEHPDAPIKLLDGELPATIEVAALINKGNPELKAELDRIITARLADGSITRINEKHVGVDLTPKQ